MDEGGLPSCMHLSCDVVGGSTLQISYREVILLFRLGTAVHKHLPEQTFRVMPANLAEHWTVPDKEGEVPENRIVSQQDPESVLNEPVLSEE